MDGFSWNLIDSMASRGCTECREASSASVANMDAQHSRACLVRGLDDHYFGQGGATLARAISYPEIDLTRGCCAPTLDAAFRLGVAELLPTCSYPPCVHRVSGRVYFGRGLAGRTPSWCGDVAPGDLGPALNETNFQPRVRHWHNGLAKPARPI